MMADKNMRAFEAGAALVGGALAATAGVSMALAAAAPETIDTMAQQTPCAEQTIVSPVPVNIVSEVQGTFAWTQTEVTDTATLARNLYGASKVLCGAGTGELAAESDDAVPQIECIAVGGDVANPCAVSVAQMKERAPISQILGCTCVGNPVDGRASGNAEVSGFKLSSLIEAAAPAEGANAITFVCADGYQVTMPLAYVLQRYSIIVDGVNGENSSEAVGCANQLWLGSTSARTFARNVTEILITCEDEVPAVPQSLAGQNLPNVSVVTTNA